MNDEKAVRQVDEISDEEMVEALHGLRDRADALELTQVECDALDRAASLLSP